MTDSPSPIDSSFDASDVATPCTVIAVRTKKGLRNRENEESEEEEEDSRQDLEEEEEENGKRDVSAIYVDDYSKNFSDDDDESVAPSVVPITAKPVNFAQNMTKVYCFKDEEEFPYMVEVHVPPDCVTLQDVKRKLPRANFKYYCIALDPESGLEVKAEVRDDSRRLYPLKNGRFELYLLSVEGSVHSDASSGRTRKKTSSKGSNGGSVRMSDYQRAAYQFDNTGITTDSESQVSLPTYVKKAQAYNRKQGGGGGAPPPSIYDRLPHLKPAGSSRSHHHHHHQNPQHHRYQNHYEESTFDITEDSEDNYRDGETYYDEDDDDKQSINTDLTSISQQQQKKKWRMQQKEMQRRQQQKWRTQPSMSTTSSSFSDVTESSMGLEVITVRLNLETMPLGMVPSGHTNARGDAGLYVGDIHDRGAVALDGRIDIGDMIVGINEHSLSNYSNRDAVELLKRAVQRQFVTLTIAKTGEQRPIRNTRQEPSRPLDPNEWMKHANAMKAMPSISEEHSSSTPIPDEWPTNSSASGTPFGGLHPTHLTVHTNKKYVVEVMAAPGSGLEIKDREWLKIPIPMSFLGQDLVDWLLDHVKGFQKRSEACQFAGELLKLGYIQHVVDKKNFSEKLYYVMGEECADYTQLRAPDGGFKYPPSGTSSAASASASDAPTPRRDNNNIFPPSMYPPRNPRASVILPGASGVSQGYASMPASPFPPPQLPPRIRDDQRSQTSGSSRSSSKRYVELPTRKTSSVGSGSVTDSISENRVASRSSFRAAMSGSHRNFSIDG